MSDVFETKKITELSESKSAADSDLLMVGNPSTGELSKITKENYLSEINEDLSNITTPISVKSYYSLAQIGLTASTATSLIVITNAMGNRSILYLAVSSENREDLYNNGVIPENTTGILEISYQSRVKYMFNTDRGRFYFCAANNGTTANPTSWAELTFEDDLNEINTSLSDLETRVAVLEKAAGISANESPSSVEPGPEESGDDDGTTVAPDPEVLNDDE